MGFDIESIKRKMLVKYNFFGTVVANVEYKENKSFLVAGTDGKVIYYNPDFFEKISVQEQIFLLAHEVCHIAFNHVLRSENKNPFIWNIATDAVINAFLKKDKLKMVEGGVDIEGAINYDAEQLYEKLLKEKQQQDNQSQQQNGQQGQSQSSQRSFGDGQSKNSQPQNGEEKTQKSENQSSRGSSYDSKENNNSIGGEDSSSQDVGHDSHSMWADAVKKHKEKKQIFNKDKQEQKSEIEKKQEELEKIGEKEAFKKNLEEKKKALEELKNSLSKQAFGYSSSTNGDVRNITDIGRARPFIDWRYILREAVRYDVDWSYKNASIENGVIGANLEEQPILETEIVLDTSGSINENLLKNFLRECKNILKYSKLKVGCFDTRFYGFNEIRTEEDIEHMLFIGGGGTNFDVAVSAFSRRVENKIIFTDGIARMPNTKLNAIWIVFGDRKINPNSGKVIYITSDDLEKLCSNQNKVKIKKY